MKNLGRHIIFLVVSSAPNAISKLTPENSGWKITAV